jgi:hypothetical protein
VLAQHLHVICHSPTRLVKAIFDRVADAGEALQVGRVKAKKIRLLGCLDDK